MKKLSIIFLLAVITTGICFAADAVEGFWISVDDKTGKATAGWEIYQSGGKLFGKILSLAGFPQTVKAEKCKDSYRSFPLDGKVNQMAVVGTPWIFNLTMDRAGQWSHGNIIDPDSGSMYQCKITFHAADGNRYKTDTLEMRGEIGLGIGRSQFWQRAQREQAAGLR
jgi:uncharacterized protein (DUF2147 family)